MPFYSALALIVGVALLSMAFRSLAHPLAQKLSVLCLLAVSFLIGWLPGGSVPMGLLCASTWLLLPWLEILIRVRKLRLPEEKALRQKRPPSRELFPDLEELTAEVEESHFEHLEDAGWDWENHSQFFRLFYRDKDRLQGAICLVDQEQVAFFYLMISTRTADGRLWTTWNYPFSTSLKLAPSVHLNRVRPGLSFADMIDHHEQFLGKHGVSAETIVPLTQEEMIETMQRELRAQIDHNLRAGVLTKTGEGEIRYSWRGMFFIWCQFLWDFVRM